VYEFSPDEVDRQRAHHQARKQGADDVDVKRIGNLGEIALEQFCREYLPAEMWDWQNEAAIRRCNPESFAGHDFEVFGYEVDVKTSRDVSAFLPESLVETDVDDDIVVLVWHRDDESGLILLGWAHTDTLQSKVETERTFEGESPAKLEHLAMRPMNELQTLGPNTANMNQTPDNPFQPGDRVRKSEPDSSVGVVVEVLPPETNIEIYGQELDGEAVRVAFPSSLDTGAGDWRDIDPALLSSYCDDQDIDLYTYKHANLQFADVPYTPGDRVVKPAHDNPDVAIVLAVDRNGGTVEVAFQNQLQETVSPEDLSEYCSDTGVTTYTYAPEELAFAIDSVTADA
jgi:hypothetical protein